MSRCSAWSGSMTRCQLDGGHDGRHFHRDGNMFCRWVVDAGRPPARVDGVLAA